MLDFIPEYLKYKILSEYPTVCEVRIRADKKTEIIYSANGIAVRAYISSSLTKKQIEECVLKLCDYSIFGIEEDLKQCFITSDKGERVGICGECVTDDKGQVSTIKSFTSLCIRLPHSVNGCSDDFFKKYITKNSSCLIFSPPFQGKTTFIRDLGRNYSDCLGLNVLYIDERGEFTASAFETGGTSDILKFANKRFGFGCGIRTMNPDVVVCDEMMNDDDFDAACNCMLSGVKIISSTHSDTIENIKKKLKNSGILQKTLFDFYVRLDGFNVAEVYNGDFKML